jgi:hypothetical protein
MKRRHLKTRARRGLVFGPHVVSGLANLVEFCGDRRYVSSRFQPSKDSARPAKRSAQGRIEDQIWIGLRPNAKLETWCNRQSETPRENADDGVLNIVDRDWFTEYPWVAPQSSKDSIAENRDTRILAILWGDSQPRRLRRIREVLCQEVATNDWGHTEQFGETLGDARDSDLHRFVTAHRCIACEQNAQRVEGGRPLAPLFDIGSKDHSELVGTPRIVLADPQHPLRLAIRQR